MLEFKQEGGQIPVLPSSAGFTLTELVIVVAVVAILMVVAIPTYQDFIMKSRRVEAKELLFTTAQRMAQYYTQEHTYSTDPEDLELGSDPVSTNGYYTLTIAAGATGIDSSYTLTATPASTQTSDTDCGNYTLNSLGTKDWTGSQTTPSCW